MTHVMSWTAARTLADLGACTAAWLRGRLPDMPVSMYCQGVGAETARIVPVLAALNESGLFVTTASQPGCTPLKRAYGGDQPWQRAAIMGFVPAWSMQHVVSALRCLEGVCVQACAPGATARLATQVSCRSASGHEVRLFGSVLSAPEIAEHYGPVPGWEDHPGLHPRLIAQLQAAYQVSVIDLRWGRNSMLWPALSRLAAT